MRFSNTFNVPLAPARAWAVLMDVEAVIPCVPGAELTEKLDDRTYKGKVSVRLGPLALSFAGTACFEEIDEVARRAKVKAQGNDAKGRGSATATVSFGLEPVADGSKILVDTDLALSGSVAQYGRASGLIQGVANQITDQFAKALAERIGDEGSMQAAKHHEDTSVGAPALQSTGTGQQIASQVKPISGLSVLWVAIRSALADFVRRRI